MRSDIPNDLASILQAGVLAPSADNHHCFQFVLLPDGIGLFVGDGHVGAPFHRRILNRISLGAVVENMVIRAGCLGYRVMAEWIPEPVEPSLIVRLRLMRDQPRDDALDEAIARRHTNRSLRFSGPPLGEDELAGFVRLLDDLPGVSLSYFDSGPSRRALLRLVRIAETERFAVKSLHEDLFSAVRFEIGWHTSAQEGLPPGALGVEAGMRWAFAQLRRWPVMNALRRIGLHHVLGLRAASLPCRLSPHCGVLTTRLSPEQAAAEVGRAMQRIWLAAERRGLAFQPLAGAALLALTEYEAVRKGTGDRLRAGWKRLTDETPFMVFRMGRASAPAVRTGRPPVRSFYRDAAGM